MNDWVKKWLPELNPAQTQLLLDKMLEIIGPNTDLKPLRDKGQREEYKKQYYINQKLDEIRSRL